MAIASVLVAVWVGLAIAATVAFLGDRHRSSLFPLVVIIGVPIIGPIWYLVAGRKAHGA